MSKIYEITGFYGSKGENETTIFVYQTRHGCWYVAEFQTAVEF